MNLTEERLLRNFSILSFATTQKGEFVFKNFQINEELSHFIQILKTLGAEIKLEGETLTLHSLGAFHLFQSEAELDVRGSKLTVYALCGLFANYDYNIFLTDSTKTLHEFSGLILGLFEAGVRFNYNKNFTLPLSMKGTSNFLPMVHTMIAENPFLNLAFLLAGLHGVGVTRVISPFPQNASFGKMLQKLQANTRLATLEDGAFDVSVCLNKQNLEQKIELDLKQL